MRKGVWRTPALVVISLTFLSTDAARAQGIYLGARGGLNISTAAVESASFQGSEDSRTSVHVGGVLAMDFSRNLGIRVDGLFSGKGFKTQDGQVSVDLTYGEILLLGVGRLPGKVSPYILAGPALSFELNCDATVAEAGSSSEVSCRDTPSGPRTEVFDVGLMFGAGVDVGVGAGKVLLEADFNLGLINLSEQQGVFDSIQNRTFYLSAGYLHPTVSP